MHWRPDADEVMLLVLMIVKSVEDERGRRLYRFRLSTSSLRKLSFRAHLREAFLGDLFDAASERNWTFSICDDHLAFQHRSKIETWPKFSTRRVGELLRELRALSREKAESRFRDIELEIGDLDSRDDEGSEDGD